MTSNTLAPEGPTPPSAWRTAARAGLLALVVMATAYVALWAPRDYGRATPIWPANALILACLLRSPPSRWWIWALAGLGGNLAADLAVGDGIIKALALSGCNVIEALLCASGLRRLIPDGFDPARSRDLAVGAAAALGSAFAAALSAASYLGLAHGGHFVVDLTVWTLADVLGMVIVTPCLLILADWRRHTQTRPVTSGGVLLVILVIVLQAVIFAQSRYPLLFLAPMAALVAVMTLEMLGAAIIVLATAVLAMGFTFAGQGPINLMTGGWTERLILLQVFVAACSALNLQVAAMHQQRRIQARDLAAALALAERSAQVKTEFLANMSHEIRTPLTSILGFASLLAEKDLGEEAGRYAQRVLGASRNLLALVNDVLDFSRLEAGQLEIKPQTGSPQQCARDVVELFSAQAGAKALSLRLSTQGLPEHVVADFDRVRQVLMNLVGNAVKFTAAGEVSVSAAYDTAAGLLTYTVRDTGAGIAPEAQALLFQRFSQVDSRLNRAHEGSGLGLAISRGLVEAMGGRIGVESTLGEGAVFWFEIPAPTAAAEDTADGPGLDLADFVGLKVLLVDDNAANRELIRSLLSPLGVALTTADGGESSIQLSRLQEFQLILMDLRMPGVDGWAAARAIRGQPGLNQATPMLAFSADITADDETVLSVFEGVVRKPIEMAELLFAIAHWTSPPPPTTATAPGAVKRPQRRR